MIAPDGKLPSDHRPDHNQRPCARRPQHVWVGAKKRDSKSNKETGMEEVESGVKYMLDFKSPIQGNRGRCGKAARQTLWDLTAVVPDCEHNLCDMAQTLRMGENAFR